MQHAWLSKKADEIQFYANCKNMKNICSALKTVYGPTTSGSSLLSADGNTQISDKEKILECWIEHIYSVLN